MTIAYITHPDCALHEMGTTHPECPARMKVIDEAVKQSNLQTLNEPAPLVTKAQVLRVHDADYFEKIFALAPKEGLRAIDPDTFMNPFTLNAALRAAGAVIYAVDLVMSGRVSSAFCNIRPPGHHAEKKTAMGFCFFNNIAIGVAHALEHYGLKRVAIVDFDVHHGNGTEDIFKNDDRVLFCSSFEHPFYPYSGSDTHSNHIINIPLSAGTTGLLFREQAKKLWFDKIREFKPEMIFFSAGFDAYYHDEMSDLLFKEEDYAWITEQIKAIADEVCQGRVVSALEGGYDLNGLGACALAHMTALS